MYYAVYNNRMSNQAFRNVMLASERCSVSFFMGYARARRDLSVPADICVFELSDRPRAMANILGHFIQTGSDLLVYVEPEVAAWHPRTIERVMQAMSAAKAFSVVSVSMDVIVADELRPDRESETTLSPLGTGPLTPMLAMTSSAVNALYNRNVDLMTEGYGGKGHAFDVFSPMHHGNKMLAEDAAFSERCRKAGLPIFYLGEKAR